ncbi:MAG: hypothetical protein WCR46_00125 [Deltaproteobacteria bacterium]
MWDDLIDWGDWAIIGPLSEDMAAENEERDKVYEGIFGEDYLEEESDADINNDFET